MQIKSDSAFAADFRDREGEKCLTQRSSKFNNIKHIIHDECRNVEHIPFHSRLSLFYSPLPPNYVFCFEYIFAFIVLLHSGESFSNDLCWIFTFFIEWNKNPDFQHTKAAKIRDLMENYYWKIANIVKHCEIAPSYQIKSILNAVQCKCVSFSRVCFF